jgi:isocitrate/isopropylmalate dehydrogenase
VWKSLIDARALDENIASKHLEKATISVLKEGKIKTPDLGGKNTTEEIAEEIISKL